MHDRSRFVRSHGSYHRPIGTAATDLLPAFRRVPTIVVALGLLLAACGGSSPSSDDAEPSAVTTGAASTEEPEGTAAGSSTDSTDDNQAADTGTNADSIDAGPIDAGPIDLTGVTLTSTDPGCTAHVGRFFSDVTDVSTGTEFTGSFTLATDGQTCVFSSNQIPNHDSGVGGDFANRMTERSLLLQITAFPEPAPTPTGLGLGPAAILLNGVPWEAYPAACFGVGRAEPGFERIDCGRDQLDNPWRYNIGSPLNDFGVDERSAHVKPDGGYHYHVTPTVLHDPDCTEAGPSPVIGFAADGFPIHGPCFLDADGEVRPARSSHRLREGPRADVDGFVTPRKVGRVAGVDYDGQFVGDHEYVEGLGDLDRCNGMTVDGRYGYYVTVDFPYVLGCFTGTPSADFR